MCLTISTLKDILSAGATIIAKNCIRQVTYYKCAGNHKANGCTVIKKKYMNCMYKIQTYNLKIHDERQAVSVKCPTYIRALEEKKKGRAGILRHSNHRRR